MRQGIILLWFWAVSWGAFSQQVNYCVTPPAGSTTGGFTVNGSTGIVRGCAPFTVRVSPTVAINDLYVYDYKGGDPIGANPGPADRKEHVYLQQGTYRILQLGSGGSTGSVFCQTVEVYYAPNFTAKSCSGRKVQVTIPSDSTTMRYDEFSINWGTGITPTRIPKSTNMTVSYTYQASANTANITVTGLVGGQAVGCTKPAAALVLNAVSSSAVTIRKVSTYEDGSVGVLIQGAQGVNAELQISEGGISSYKGTGQMTMRPDTLTIVVKNIDATKNTYCFKMSANDGCDNAGTTSKDVCTTNLEVKPENNQNALSWNPYPIANDFLQYSFTKGTAPWNSITNRNTTTQNDRNVNCGQQYCYQMTVNLGGGVTSVSPLRCVKTISTDIPSPVRNAFVSVLEEEQKIEIRSDPPATGTTPAKFKTIYLRAENGSNNFVEIGTKDGSLTFIDPSADPAAQSYCYKIQYENNCGNRSEPTQPICSIQLYSKSGSTIDWTPESPFLTPVNRYELEILDEQGTLIDQRPLGANTTFDPNLVNPDQQEFRYRILAYSQGAPPRQSYSNTFVFQRNAVVFVPDAFSPNSDNINDIFAPKGRFLDTSRLIIYNRWGQPLFETPTASKGWDGTVSGQPALEGTYVYRIEITDSLGKRFVKVGTVLLMR